jgi:PEP-CTERM motif
MTHLRRIAVLVGFLGTVAPAGWGAQAGGPTPVPVALVNGNVLNAFGLTATISSCSATCNGDSIELISSGRDTISIETINTATSGSAILAPATGSPTTPVALSYTLTFALNPSSTLKGTVVNSATQTAVGSDNCTGGCTTATGSATLAASTVTFSPSATLTDNLTTTTASNTVSIPSGASTFSTGTNAFTVAESLNLHGSATTTDLAFNTLVLKLNTAPEPASMSVMLIALGGLAAARRRRSS